ncbi:MAG: hypothetical protein IJ809_01750 [Clostridia bacterium]|nr:hypothetical protein [Clostridia bacterium]
MEKYSKSKLVAKRYILVFAFIFLVILVYFGIYLFKMLTTDKVEYYEIDRVASSASEEEAKKATPIIINNILMGGVYNGKWVDSLKYYKYSENKVGTEIDVFNEKGKNGTFKIDDIYTSSNKYDTVYVKIIKNDYISEYYALAKGVSGLNLGTKVNITKENEKEYLDKAKRAISDYNYINGSMKLQEAYNVALSFENKYTLLFVTNDGHSDKGIYSAIVAIPNIGEPFCVRYNYYKDAKNAPDFEYYSFKFVGDLNSDGVSEIIVQATREFTTSYYVLELRNGKLKQILETTIIIN